MVAPDDTGLDAPGPDGPDASGPDGAGDIADADGAGGRRSRVVLYTSLSVAVVIAVFVAVLASSKPAANGTASSPLIGKAAPPVSGPALGGGARYSLGQFAGKWVLVNFAASWCVPCRQETPQLLQFAKEHAATGDATILTVAFDPTDVSNLASFLAGAKAPWPAVNDPNAEVAYGVSAIPQSYLVDPSGTVVAKYFGEVTAAQLDSVIQKATAA